MLSEFENNLNVELPTLLENKNKKCQMYTNSKDTVRPMLNVKTGQLKH